jgi:hypothetical protein
MFASAAAALLGSSAPLRAQDVVVVNMIPLAWSNEISQDSEPHLTVDPADPNRIVASAFTWDNPLGSAGPTRAMTGDRAPLFVSTDGGHSWVLSEIVPSGTGNRNPTSDITTGFGSLHPGRLHFLYAGILRSTDTALSVLRGLDPLGTAPLTELETRGGVDQPFVGAPAEGAGSPGHFLMGNNNNLFAGPRTATVDLSLDAAAPAPVFEPMLIETRDTAQTFFGHQDGPSVRTAAHADGTVYAAFFGWRSLGTLPDGLTLDAVTDVVVVRDDASGAGASRFAALTDSDGRAGLRVAASVRVPWGRLGLQRIGSSLSIAVDPRDSSTVYLAWCDGDAPETYTVHVRRSTTRGTTWSADLRTVVAATNPALAISADGTVGFLYQRLAGDPIFGSWETHFERTGDAFATLADNLLSTFSAWQGGPFDFNPYLGDYVGLVASGRTFYGVFSASNWPDMANFPSGVTYQRRVNWGSHALRDTADTADVAISMDPFFFKTRDEPVTNPCDRRPWLCRGPDAMGPGFVDVKCEVEGCRVVDPVRRNCLVKWQCPGCQPGAHCLPYYALHFAGPVAGWRIGLIHADGRAVAFEKFESKREVVLSFRPDEADFVDGQIGNYSVVFERVGKVKHAAPDRLKTWVERGESPFKPDSKGALRASQEN